ncbi:hypothetical protein EZV62_007497 [Acer yangbiense]|uniref:CCHC-type domain-containing protein n=1 Tax=Acer yangbiense TaxID=1000413 RepID=A0A5C7IBW4_9ROSI|nr:hypothetical protein EZV62_007497 [Acer yangbiense]
MMNENEIARLCASMTLKEREGPVRKLQADLKNDGLRRLATSLVGKVLSPKPVNRDGFRVVMRKIWKTRDEVEIEALKDNIFAFHFQNPDDKRKIISGGPWSFNDALIVMEEPEGKGDIIHMQFTKVEFWIQIHNVPMLCMTKDIGCFLGTIVGEVVEVDEGDTGSYTAKFLRVRVILEIDKPLRRCLRIDVMGDGVESVMLLKYERLPDFCFRCGLIGHSVKDCPEKAMVAGKGMKEDFIFGSWMRGFPPNRKMGSWGRKWEPRGGYGSNLIISNKGNGGYGNQIDRMAGFDVGNQKTGAGLVDADGTGKRANLESSMFGFSMDGGSLGFPSPNSSKCHLFLKFAKGKVSKYKACSATSLSSSSLVAFSLMQACKGSFGCDFLKNSSTRGSNTSTLMQFSTSAGFFMALDMWKTT